MWLLFAKIPLVVGSRRFAVGGNTSGGAPVVSARGEARGAAIFMHSFAKISTLKPARHRIIAAVSAALHGPPVAQIVTHRAAGEKFRFESR